MKNFNAGSDSERKFKYAEWINSLRLPLVGRRAAIVNDAFNKVSGLSADNTFTVAQAK